MDPNPRPKWDVHNPHSRLGQMWVQSIRKVYNPIGFHKGYNFPLFLIGAGGLLGFVLARMFYLDYDGVFSRDAAPGEFYYYQKGHYKVGIIMHLVGVLIGGFLAVLQFIPVIRYRLLLFHRINGYFALIFFLIGNAGAFMIMRHAVGGSPVLQVWIGVVGAMTTIALALAYINIKLKQIDQHRIWMLRLWTWAGSVVSIRLILLAAQHCSKAYGYIWYTSIPCDVIWFMYGHVGVPAVGNPTAQLYPSCAVSADGQTPVDPQTNSATYVTVSSSGSGPENAAAMFHVMFPMAAWLAIAIHVIALETYLWLTPAEHYRLRNVSYQKQVEAGLRREGSRKDAGLTSTRLGDAPEWWSIPAEKLADSSRKASELSQDSCDKSGLSK